MASLNSTTTILENEKGLFVSVFDSVSGLVYFGGGNSVGSGRITQLQSSPLAQRNTTTITEQILSGVLDSTRGTLYLGTISSNIFAVSTSNMSVIGKLSVGAGLITCGVIDAAGML